MQYYDKLLSIKVQRSPRKRSPIFIDRQVVLPPKEEPLVNETLDLRRLSLKQIKSKPSISNISLKLLLKVVRRKDGEVSVLEKYIAAQVIIRHIKAFLTKRKAFYMSRKSKIQAAFLALAEEQYAMRSNTSRFDDPILPSNLDSVKNVAREGRFLTKRHQFIY